MIKVEENTIKKVTAKGIIKSISEDGFVIYDAKEDMEETLFLDDLQFLVGKNATLSLGIKE